MLSINADTIARIIADNLVHSVWNRPEKGAQSKAAGGSGSGSVKVLRRAAVVTALSFSGFEAHIRGSHIEALEKKLRYA